MGPDLNLGPRDRFPAMYRGWNCATRGREKIHPDLHPRLFHPRVPLSQARAPPPDLGRRGGGRRECVLSTSPVRLWAIQDYRATHGRLLWI